MERIITDYELEELKKEQLEYEAMLEQQYEKYGHCSHPQSRLRMSRSEYAGGTMTAFVECKECGASLVQHFMEAEKELIF